MATSRRWRARDRIRLFLDAKYPNIVDESEALLRSMLPDNRVGRVLAHEGRMAVLWAYSSHLTCLFPQHGAGKKHERPIALEPWQQELVAAAPWAFLRGCIRSDGCVFVNRTGRYEYLSYDFCNLLRRTSSASSRLSARASVSGRGEPRRESVSTVARMSHSSVTTSASSPEPATRYHPGRSAAVAELADARASGARELYARGGSSPLSRILRGSLLGPRSATLADESSLPLSSRGLGRRPLTAETGVRIPVAVPLRPAHEAGFVVLVDCARRPARKSVRKQAYA